MNQLPWPLVALILTALITTALGLYAWVASIRSGTDCRLGKVELEVAVIGERIAHLPTSSEVAALTVAVTRLTTEVESTGRLLNALTRRIELHEEAELERERTEAS